MLVFRGKRPLFIIIQNASHARVKHAGRQRILDFAEALAGEDVNGVPVWRDLSKRPARHEERPRVRKEARRVGVGRQRRNGWPGEQPTQRLGCVGLRATA